MPEGPEHPRSSPTDLDALLGRVERRIAEERGPPSGFRRRPLPVRVAVIVAAGLSTALAARLAMPRPDWGFERAQAGIAGLELAHLVIILGSALGLLAGATLAAWPLSRRAPTTRQIALVGVGVGLLALGMGVVLGHGRSPSELLPMLRCAALGVASGVPAAMVALAAKRDAAGSTVGAVAVGAAVALLTETVTCPVETHVHLVVGHALPPGLAGAIAVLLYLRPIRV